MKGARLACATGGRRRQHHRATLRLVEGVQVGGHPRDVGAPITLPARDAERRGELLSEPPSSQDVEFYDQNLASLPEEQLVPTLEQMSRQQFARQNPLSNLYQSFSPSLSSFTGLPQAHRGN